jgi:hypothetical protein
MQKSKELLETIVRALVSNPDAVKVADSTDEMGVLLTLDVHPDDMGKVIGRSGNTAKAIRTLIRVIGMTENARISLKINEPEGSTRPAPKTDAETLA